MSASVRISLKCARELLGLLEVTGDGRPTQEQRELEAAIHRASRASSVRRTLRKPREEKRASKKLETAAIREAVMARARRRCELCGGNADGPFPFASLELHHALGRVRAKQSEANTLGICGTCHRALTRNEPSVAYWLTRQAECFERLGHHLTTAALRRRLAFVEARVQAQAVSK